MLGKEYRLNTSEEFARVKELGKKFHSKNFLFSYFKRTESKDTCSRFGLVVTTKMFSRSVDRNRIRRVISESVRQNTIHVQPGFDCVFIPKPEIIKAYTSDLMKEVYDAFVSADITKRGSK